LKKNELVVEVDGMDVETENTKTKKTYTTDRMEWVTEKGDYRSG
jgi:hypothetical protein